MLKFLREPYPLPQSPAVKIFQAFGLPFAIFSILAFVRPFGISEAPESLIYKIAFQFALCTFVPLCINLFVIIPLFEERKWTLGKEILFTLWNFFIIGLINFLFAWHIGFARMEFGSLLYFFFATVAVGFVPVMLYSMVKQYLLMRHYRMEALAVTGRLEHKVQPIAEEKKESDSGGIVLAGENPSNTLTLFPDTLLFIAAADNYIELFRTENGKVTKTLWRSTLKKAEEQLAADPKFLRVHRGYLANLSKVISVSGNAQGYELHFEGTDLRVPVSRRLNGIIESLR